MTLLETDLEFAVHDPATGDVIATVPDAGTGHARRAAETAAATLPSWAATAPRRRSEILAGGYRLMVERSDELTRLISRESGKAQADARAEVAYAAEFFRWFAEEAVRPDGHFGIAPDGAPSVEHLLAGLGCRVGTGTAVPAAEAGVSYAAATTALAAATDRSPLVRWDERFRGDIRAGLTDDAARVLAARILGGLAEEPELRRTLRAYLTHLGRWQPTAAELGIHRNTLRKRVARIEALTGRSVDTAAGRADLWIALEIAGEHITLSDDR
jgi:Aldehyde dehydrogenase family/PucR C-terminal helix-turn-helix domain